MNQSHNPGSQRRDLELVEIVQRATNGLRSQRATRQTPRPAITSREGLPLPAFALALFLLFALPVAATLRVKHTEPSFLTDAAAFVHMKDGSERATSGRFFVTAVRTPALHGKALAQSREGIRASQESALAAALRCVDSSDGTGIRFDTLGHTGASGGLIYALTIVDALDARDIADRRQIAGTGTITADGTVGPILEIGLKARAAERSGADLFLAPSNQVIEARHAAATLRVVGVRTLGEAIRALTGGRACR